jgi:hypothetical protein
MEDVLPAHLEGRFVVVVIALWPGPGLVLVVGIWSGSTDLQYFDPA